MKLDAITTRMLHRAVEIYLEYAYRDTEPPYHVRARACFDLTEPLEKVLASESFEKAPGEDAAVSRFLMRLGNAR
jgi:hypothetical protein